MLFSQGPPAGAPQVPLLVEEDPVLLASAVEDFGADVAVLSPGIAPGSPLGQALSELDVPLTGEVQLAWDLTRLDGEDSVPWLCVTGTNGKTTTVGMLSSILQAAGKTSPAVGNIGYPITRAVQEPADALAVELSSFQLATLRGLRPLASICLNIDDDHLDWHGSREQYALAKARVYDGVSRARIFFQDEPRTRQMAENASGADSSALVPLAFGEVPRGALGLSGTRVIDRAFGAGSDGEVLFDLSQVPTLFAPGADGSDPLVRDALAAAALARAAGVEACFVREGLASFSPAGHRRALVETTDGVRWINDSKATNVHAALAAARTVEPGKLVWIVGGDAKGQDLTPLFELAGKQAKALVLVGADSAALLELYDNSGGGVALHTATGGTDGPAAMRNAVRACADFALPGDTVLLAPGCASWDQFSSYEERGTAFAEAVRELQVKKGD